jgi:putative transposase
VYIHTVTLSHDDIVARMERLVPLTTDETYHIYNRGAHKSAIFTRREDYERFLLLLFLCNGVEPISIRSTLAKYRGRFSVKVFQDGAVLQRKKLVSIHAYSLMPNHFHLVMHQAVDNGVSVFMKKVCVGYSMYFNTKYEHSGVLFQGRFKSSHIDTERYFKHIFSYVHLNPVELIEREWKEEGIRNKNRTRDFLNGYGYSSFYDYSVGPRPERAILSYDDAPDFLKDQNDLEEMLSDYADYFEENAELPRTDLGKG